MKIVVSGMVGLDKKEYLEEVCDYARRQGKEILLCNVGDRMYAEAPDVPPGRILDISRERLHSLRRSVFKDILAQARTHEHVIVNTHATFRWRHGLFPAFDFYQTRALKADLFICIIDSAERLHVRLKKDHRSQHTLKDLLVWREEEILGTQMMQQGTRPEAPFYCLARGLHKNTVETFYRLAFEPQRPRAYLSFPMTHVAGLPDVIAEIDRFRETMKEIFTCFDPGDLEEAYLPYYAKKAKQEGQKTIEVKALGQTVQFDVEEVLQIETDINSQIYARDFMLIDQSEMIISFVPALPDGMPALSSGVERELQHAHETAKQVYVIWIPKKAPSVFVTQTASRVFSSAQEALDFFRKEYGGRI
ncbi:MAG TPA: AAA family ATPase [Anaerohalosphaeraceae bacterium]|nr:AAA family ATPase [Anaerohalosphaeraceae bacterium]HOL88121.1 AAA family ATPase [Anaerohalosphaeraceae bacterium]HPP55369.1 AAA family ATPase [Anaerohalosphaeraceae bacterium]